MTPTRGSRPRRSNVGKGVLVSLLAWLLVAPFAGPVAPAGAASNGAWSLLPTAPPDAEPPGRSFFVYDLRPGQTLRDSVTLANLTDRPLSFRLFPADAYNTPVDAAFALRQPDEPREDVGSWIDLRVTEYTLGPRMQVVIPFAVNVPPDAAPGDHAGGIVAQEREPGGLDRQGDVAVAVRRGVGVRMYARVSGPLRPELDVPSLRVDRRQPLVPYVTGRGSATVEYEVANTGNARLSPQAELVVHDLFGRTKRFPARSLPELLPGQRVRVTEEWKGLPPVGRLEAEVTVTAGRARAERATAVWVVPWLLVALLVAGTLAAWRRRRRRRRRAAATPAAPPPTARVPVPA